MKINVHKHARAWQYNKMLYAIVTFVDMTKQLLTTKFLNTKLNGDTLSNVLKLDMWIPQLLLHESLHGRTIYNIYHKLFWPIMYIYSW
jgi:hypothetical protein